MSRKVVFVRNFNYRPDWKSEERQIKEGVEGQVISTIGQSEEWFRVEVVGEPTMVEARLAVDIREVP